MGLSSLGLSEPESSDSGSSCKLLGLEPSEEDLGSNWFYQYFTSLYIKALSLWRYFLPKKQTSLSLNLCAVILPFTSSLRRVCSRCRPFSWCLSNMSDMASQRKAILLLRYTTSNTLFAAYLDCSRSSAILQSGFHRVPLIISQNSCFKQPLNVIALESAILKYSAAKFSSNSILEKLRIKKSKMSMPQITPPIYASRSNSLQQLRRKMVLLSDLQTVTQVLVSPLFTGISVTTFPNAPPTVNWFRLNGNMLLSLVMLLESIWQEFWKEGTAFTQNLVLSSEYEQGEDAFPRFTVELAVKNYTYPQVAAAQLEGQAKRNWMFLYRSLVMFDPPIWKQEFAGRQCSVFLVHWFILFNLPGSIPKWSAEQLSKLSGTLETDLLGLVQAPVYQLTKASKVMAELGQRVLSMLTVKASIKGAYPGSVRLVLRVVRIGSAIQVIWVLDITIPQVTIWYSFRMRRIMMMARRGSETSPPHTLLQLLLPLDLQKLFQPKMLVWRIKVLIMAYLK